jgi:anti-anti-sigma factor
MTADRRQPPPESTSPGGGLRNPGTGGEEPPVLDQVFDKDSLYALRAAVAAHGSRAGLAEGRLGDLVLAVHELASNAICHGAGHGRLRIWMTTGTLRCEVSDDGPAQAAGQDDGGVAFDVRDPAQWNIAPGHGLWMIRQIADQVSMRGGSAGTVAVFTLVLPGQQPSFRLVRQARDRCVLLSVTGPFDLGSAGQLTAAVDDLTADGRALSLVVDLSGLTGWDSSGLAALITIQQRVTAQTGAQMIVAGPPGQLEQRLRDAALPCRFTLAKSVDDALGMLTSPP